MKKFLLILPFVLQLYFISAQEYNNTVKDTKPNEDILIGYCTKEGLLASDFQQYYDKNYESYQFDFADIDKLNMLLDNVRIVVVMGTWCEDSQREIPRFFKIMDHLLYPSEQIIIVCVDSGKNAGDVDLGEYKIEKVPTIIFYRDDGELGRIVEKPKVSLEKDMLQILSENKK